MARRPIFIPQASGNNLVERKVIDFTWYAGFATSQAQKSIRSLHSAAAEQGISPVLDISSKSPDTLGVQLSAFNLSLRYNSGSSMSVECAFQGSKVFELGGPYTDLYGSTSREAKKDERLRDSGALIRFSYMGEEWSLQPVTAFYDWLYLNALEQNAQLSVQLLTYNAFSDIAFNPERSWNCQAHAAALYVSLHWRNLLKEALFDREAFMSVIVNSGEVQQDSEVQEQLVQQSLL